MSSHLHDYYMKRCIELGHLALRNGNPPVGSLIVVNDQIISQATEEAHTTKKVTDHAEILAIYSALEVLPIEALKSAILYSTHEPCVMCGYAIRHYRIGHVVFGCKVAVVGGFSSRHSILTENEHPSWPEIPKVEFGIMENECLALTKEYNQLKNKSKNRG